MRFFRIRCAKCPFWPINCFNHFSFMNELDSYSNKPLDSRQVRAFLVLVHMGSFTKAAKKLSLTQSAVSHAIRALEEDLGCRLLDRVGKKVLLTQAGEQFHERAENIFNEMILARSELNKLGEWGHGRLRIGATAAACQHIMPSILREFQKEFPKCHLTIIPANTSEIIELLHNNKIDVAITWGREPDSDDNFTPLFDDELVFVVSPDHPWAKARRIKRTEVSRQQYILYNSSTSWQRSQSLSPSFTRYSGIYEQIESHFKNEGVVIKSVIDVGSMSAIKELVKLGLGITILPAWVAQNELKEKSLVALPLGRRKLKRQWGVLYMKGRSIAWAGETFIKLSQSSTRQFAARNGLKAY